METKFKHIFWLKATISSEIIHLIMVGMWAIDQRFDWVTLQHIRLKVCDKITPLNEGAIFSLSLQIFDHLNEFLMAYFTGKTDRILAQNVSIARGKPRSFETYSVFNNWWSITRDWAQTVTGSGLKSMHLSIIRRYSSTIFIDFEREMY